MSGNRAPCSVWCLRDPRKHPETSYVRTTDDDLVMLALTDAVVLAPPRLGSNWMAVGITRADARLLARRINECLDATVKR